MEFNTFDKLWEAAEQSGQNAFSGKEAICNSIKTILDEYIRLDQIPSPEIKNILQTKKLGEILYRITELSRTDNVNVFAALLLEVEIANKINQSK